jgi:hypothetical protein
MSALARHFGSAVRPVEVEARPVRTLAEIACENAVEGCVRETWGAAVAAYQAACAQDRTIRRVMGSIAADEAEHAALGWAVDAWACSLLSVHERAHVGQARTQAHADLVSQAAEAAPHETLGLPGAAASLRMLRELRPLWAA